MRWLFISCVFAAILIGHFFYATRPVSSSSGNGAWASFEFEQPEQSRLMHYFEPGNYWLGLSYGLAGAFVTFALTRAVNMRRQSLGASTGGIALGGLLWVSVCFLTGCCGSPMLPIYLGLLGPKFLGVTKPFTFVLTLLSILIGYTVLLRRARKIRTGCLDGHER
ncbi:MAG: hypothetical protein GWP08_10590 [Nitrospiraceae bacterium]|nr:hypothetical protein [Nitrospiraceae bacterium]